MPTKVPSPVSAIASSRPSVARPSFEPENPYDRALCRVKGEGRRRIVAGLVAMNVSLSRIPRALLRESISANEYGALWRKNCWSLAGEMLPDVLPGEVEEARLLWQLPDDERVISLRARPHGAGAIWRAVDDKNNLYSVPGEGTHWPFTDAEVALLFDRLESESFLHPIGALAACWEIGRSHGLTRERVRSCVYIRSVTRGLPLKEAVDELFHIFWEAVGETSEVVAEEAIQ